MSERDPVGTCRFCGYMYYIWKLSVHEPVCTLRPRRLTVIKAVKMAIKSSPRAAKDRALLVRLVWQMVDGYHTEPPPTRLTDPGLIVRRAKSITR